MSQKVRLLTFNVKMLPGPAGEGVDDLARAHRICDAILAHRGYDILCFQEVFDEEARGVFETRLKQAYPKMVAKSAHKEWFEEDSGLFFATRLDMVSHGFHEYDAVEPYTSDAFSDKGIFGARIRLADKSYLLVFNTHLQASEAYSETRGRQLREALRFVRRPLRAAPSSVKVGAVLAGDLNVVAEVGAAPTQEYRAMISRLGYPTDLFRALHPAAAGYTWNPPENTGMIPADDHDLQRLDYVLSYEHIPVADDGHSRTPIQGLGCGEILIEQFGTDAKTRLSDHFALGAQLSFG